MHFRLLSLGEVGLVDAGGAPVDFPLGKPFGILAYLALSTEPIPRDELAAVFWSADRSRARHSLRQALSYLRQRLGEDIFATDDPVALKPTVLETDVGLLEAALGEDDVDRVLALYRGPFLETFHLSASPAWAHWVEAQRRVLEERVAAALRDAAERAPVRSVELLRRVVEIEPHRIRHRRALVERLLGRGEVEEATAVVAETRQAELGDADAVAELEARVRAVREARRAAAEGSDRRPEFVGRTTELASLTGAWREAVAGRRQIAVVSGPTGIGKTRLAEELALVAGSRGRVVHVKASAVERRLEGSVTAELARALYRLPGGAGVGTAAMSVLRSLVPSLGSPSAPAGQAVGPAPRPVAVSDALVDLVGAVAYESPVLIVLDDVQWVDRSSLALLLRMARQLRGEPVMVLFTFRSEELGSREQATVLALAEEEGGTVLRLGPLGRAEVQEMLLLDLDEPPERIERLSGRLHDVTRGHPLFLVELFHSLRDDGVLVPANGAWRLREPGPVQVELPASVRTVIDRRLDTLSEEARRLGAELAALPPSAGLERVRGRTGLSDADFTAALNELVDRAVVTWDPSGRLAFTHDQLREALTGAGGRKVGRWAAAGLAVVAAVILAALLFGGGEPPARWGGGTIIVPDGDTLVALDAGLPPDRWEPKPASIWRPDEAGAIHQLTPSRLADGRVAWAGSIPGTVEAPEGVVYREAGDPHVRHWPGDDAIQDISPDGQRIAWVTQHYGGDGYAKELRLARLDEETGTPVAGPASLFRSAWSPDGTRLAVSAALERDSLLVLTPAGDRLRAWSFYQVHLEGWCGTDQVLAVVRTSPTAERTRRLLAVGTGTETVLERHALPGARCSPDGTAYVARVMEDAAIRLVITEIASGDRYVLPAALGGGLNVYWLPDTVPPVPVALEAERDTLRLERGGTAVLAARVRLFDREHRAAAVPWRSTDPSVASVVNGTTVAANRPGQTLLVGEYAGWWADTIVVNVVEGDGESLVMADDFRSLAPASWYTIGHPAAEVARVDGRTVLELRGDGRYTDGVISRTARTAPGGFTVELEFRIPITAREYQRFGLQVGNFEPPEAAESWDHLSAWQESDAILMAVPAFELDKWDPRLVGFRSVSRLEDIGRLPEGSSTATWTHAAIQVQADGMASLWIDRQQVARLRVPTDLLRRPLRVVIVADTHDTHAYVRNFVWWSEPRFPGGASPGPRR